MRDIVRMTICYALVAMTSACAGNAIAPTDQFIDGDFEVTTEWQTIMFDQPLETVPHRQDLSLNFDPEHYEFTQIDGKADPLDRVGDETILRKKDNEKLFPKVIFINQNDKELLVGINSMGTYFYGKNDHERRLTLGFSTNASHKELYFSPDTKIKAIKIKANTPMTIESMHWLAARYSQFPNKTWDDIGEGKILEEW